MSFERKYIRWSESCVWQPIGDTLAIVKVPPPESGFGFGDDMVPGMMLNVVGRDIWDLCDGTRTFDSIVDQLLEEYKGDPEKIRENVKKAIENLEKEGFLTFEDNSNVYDVLNLPLSGYPVWNDTVIWNEIEGQVMAMNDETGVPLKLTDEMAELWKLCTGSHTVNEVITLLEDKGFINEDMPPAGIKLALKQWIKLGMVTVKEKENP